MTRQHHGNSLTEYMVPFALIGISSLILLFGIIMPNFSESLPALMRSKPDPTNPTRLISNTIGENPFTQTLSITLENGQQVTLADYPSNLAQMVETIGADGTTELLLANLSELSAQLLQQGEITQDQFNQLEALANQGHRLAAIERLIAETNLQNNGNIGQFRNASLVFEGKTYSGVTDLANEIGSLRVGTIDRYPQTAEAYADLREIGLSLLSPERVNGSIYGNELLTFLREYQTVSTNGALDNPAVRDVVQSLTSQIASLADTTNSTANTIFAHNQGFSASEFNIAQAAEVSRSNSNDICKTGGKKRATVKCTQR